MSFTLQEVENIANQVLDYHLRDKPLSQTIQEKPFTKALYGKRKKFPGGKGAITGRVKNDYTTTFMGYSHDDTVTYKNPANVKQFSFNWFEHHAGLKFTGTELKNAGIRVVDSLTGEDTATASDSEMMILSNLLDDKLEDMDEGTQRSLDQILHLDGTQSAKVTPGLLALIKPDPTSGVVGGIDQGGNAWWRNRAKTGANKITASASLQTLTKTLRSEVRQLKRYGGKPSLLIAGSAFIDALELEVAEKGIYTQSGFVNNGTNDIGMSDISMRGVGTFVYDPTLDDLGYSKFCWMIDPSVLQMHVLDGDDFQMHAPARPPEKYVFYRGCTLTFGLIVKKLNAHGVYEVA